VLDDGRRFRILTVVDDFTRTCLAIDVDTSIGGGDQTREARCEPTPLEST
jgi:putative transposase